MSDFTASAHTPLQPQNLQTLSSFWSLMGFSVYDVLYPNPFSSHCQTEESYFATVKLIYTVGYSVSLTVLAVAVLILLLFRLVQITDILQRKAQTEFQSELI